MELIIRFLFDPLFDVFLVESPVGADLKSRDLSFARIPMHGQRMDVKIFSNFFSR